MITATSRARLVGCLPELVEAFGFVQDDAAALGLVIEVTPGTGGKRSTERQAALYADSLAQGGGVLAYPVAKPGTGKHEVGAAADYEFVNAKDRTDANYKKVADLARTRGLIAGYYFKNKDLYHLELPGSYDDLRQRLSAAVGRAVPRAVADSTGDSGAVVGA